MFRKGAIPKLEAELAALRARRDRLVIRQEQTAREDAIASKSFGDLLSQEDPTDQAVMRAATQRSRTSIAAQTIVDAIAAVDAEIAEVAARLEEARDKERRQKLAAELDAQAEKIDVAATDLQRAISGARSSYRQLMEALRASGAQPGLHADTILKACVRSVSSTVLPWSESDAIMFGPAPVDGREAARKDHSDPLRMQAQEILAGRVPPELPSATAPQPPKVVIPDMEIVLAEAISFFGVDGRLVQVPEGGVTIPAPVGEASIAKGIGHAPGTATAAAIMAELAQGELVYEGLKRRPERQSAVRRGPPYKPLNVNLYDFVRQQQTRLAGGAS